MIGRLKPTGEGAGLQFPGWIIRRAQRRFEDKLYKVIGAAKLAHRKSRWKLQKNNFATEIDLGLAGTPGRAQREIIAIGRI